MTDRTIPSMRKKACGKKTSAVVTLTDSATGRRRDYMLGEYGSPEAARDYADLIRNWKASGYRIEFSDPTPEQRLEAAPKLGTVAELCIAYAKHLHDKGGVSDKHIASIKRSTKITRLTCGWMPINEFGPKALKSVRQAMLDIRFGENNAKRWKRTTVNRRVGYVVGMIEWAVSEERAPVHLPAALKCVKALKAGDYGVEDGDRVKPAPSDHVDAIREHVSSVVWAMIQVQRYSAARAGEVCIMRPIDIDTTGKVWLYRPSAHKNAHRGHDRIIYLGSKAQKAVKPLLAGRAVDAYMFSPRESMAERRAANATKGKPRRDDQKPTPTATERKIRDKFTADSYRRAITRACEAANIPSWSTHQLRHLAATNARKEFGAEAALLVLGDKSTRLVDVYAEKDHARAQEVIAKIG